MDLSFKKTAPAGAATLPREELVVMGLEPEDKARFTDLVGTNPEPPARTDVASPGKTLQLISKTEYAPLKVVKTESMEAAYPGTRAFDANSTNLEQEEDAVESGGTLSEKRVAGRPDASLEESERVTTGRGLFLVSIVVISVAFVAGIWLGTQAAHLRSVTAARKPAMKRAKTAVARKGSTTHFSASVAPPAKQEAISTSGQVPLLAVTPEKLSKFPRVTGIRHWSAADFTNIVLDLEGQVQYEAHRLTSPDRIYFDLHNTQLAPDLAGKSIVAGDMPVSRIRIAQPVAGTTRVVLLTDHPSDFTVNLEANPYRLVIQVGEITQTLANKVEEKN